MFYIFIWGVVTQGYTYIKTVPFLHMSYLINQKILRYTFLNRKKKIHPFFKFKCHLVHQFCQLELIFPSEPLEHSDDLSLTFNAAHLESQQSPFFS